MLDLSATHRVSPAECWSCGEILDASSGWPRKPRDGDISVCAYCGAVAIFDDGRLREPTDTERLEIFQSHPHLPEIQRTIRGMREEREDGNG